MEVQRSTTGSSFSIVRFARHQGALRELVSKLGLFEDSGRIKVKNFYDPSSTYDNFRATDFLHLKTITDRDTYVKHRSPDDLEETYVTLESQVPQITTELPITIGSIRPASIERQLFINMVPSEESKRTIYKERLELLEQYRESAGLTHIDTTRIPTHLALVYMQMEHVGVHARLERIAPLIAEALPLEITLEPAVFIGKAGR